MMDSGPIARRDSELKNYLERVEKLDVRRQTRQTRNEPPTIKPKSKHLNKSYAAEDLKNAQIILDGEYTSERYESCRQNDDRSDMAYKSAYNYEKTFSPKKHHGNSMRVSPTRSSTLSSPAKRMVSRSDSLTLSKFDDHDNNSKSYMVSKEDYLLLKQLKGQMGEDETMRELVPSRGKPRELRSVRSNLRPQTSYNKRTSFTDISSEEEETPPPLPSRSALDSSAGSSDENEAPKTPVRRDSHKKVPPQVPPKRTQFEAETGKPGIEISSRGRPNPYIQGTEELGHDNGKAGNATKDYFLQRKRAEASERIVPRLQSSGDSYDSSKGLNTEEKRSPVGLGFAKNSISSDRANNAASVHMSSLDSLKNNKVNAKTSKEIGNSSLPSRRSDPNKGEPANSSLKSTNLSPTTLKNWKPMVPKVPLKPVSLHNDEVKTQEGSENNKKPAIYTARLNLKPVKEKPQVPEKKISMEINLNPVVRGRKEPDLVSKFAKVNAPRPISSTAKPVDDIPEAIKKREKLSKAPPVPQRKISMPDALKRAEAIRQSRTQNSNGSATQEKPKNSDITHEALMVSRKLRPVSSDIKISQSDSARSNPTNPRDFLSKQKSKTFDGFGSGTQKPVAIPFMAQPNDAKIAKLFQSKTESSLGTVDQKDVPALKHVTKGEV